jgi:hypothetical protein
MKKEAEAALVVTAPDTLGRAVANFQCRIRIMLDSSGSYIENIFN